MPWNGTHRSQSEKIHPSQSEKSMHTLPPDREWLSVDDLAIWLGIPRGTVLQHNHRGTGPARHKIGRTVRYARQDVLDWLAGKRRA